MRNHRKSSMGRSRDFGTGAGKGDADRVSDAATFAKNFSKIEWPILNPEGFLKVGSKLVKTYGVRPKFIINPAWEGAPMGLDEIVPPYATLDRGPEPATEDFESWDR